MGQYLGITTQGEIMRIAIAGVAEAEAEGLADIMAIEREEKIITVRKQLAVTVSEDQKLSIEGPTAPVIAAV